MNKKSFFLGVLTGIVLTFAGLIAISSLYQKDEVVDQFNYLEKPVSYENKEAATFKVFQVLDNAALATEASDNIGEHILYGGNTVLITGNNLYNEQTITFKNPQMVGTYRYITKDSLSMTVPIIDGEIE